TVTGLIDGTVAVGPDDSMVSLDLGSHDIDWIADDGFNQTPLTQTLELVPAFWATRALDVRDRAKVLQPDQSPALVVNSGSWYSKLGSAPGLVGTLLRHARVESFGATVDGDLRTQSSSTPHNGAQVTGDVFQW